MKYIKLKNKATGKFCTGSGDFDFDNEGKIFNSREQLTRYIRTQATMNKELINSCKNDIEVVEFELIPQSTTDINISNYLK